MKVHVWIFFETVSVPKCPGITSTPIPKANYPRGKDFGGRHSTPDIPSQQPNLLFVNKPPRIDRHKNRFRKAIDCNRQLIVTYTMTDESSSAETSSTAAPVATETPPPATASASTWALPAGIEDDIEQALFKATTGALVGGVLGLALFKGGKGTRAASIATGVGAGLGSTWERIKFRYATDGN